MALPKIEYPIYELKLFSKNKPVKFRPFLVKEQKLLMMAVESKNLETVVDTLKQIINNCAMEEIDVENLPMIDVELFFLNLRARSVGEVIDVFFKCKNLVEEKECGMVIEVPVDLLKDVQVVNKVDTTKIMFSEDVGVLMRYPTLNQIKILDEEENIGSRMIIECIDKIFDEDEIYDAKDATEEELLEFVEGLSATDYAKLESFLQKVPTVQYTNRHVCPKCSFTHNVKLEGLNDFFT